MYWQRTLSIPQSRQETERILKQQLRTYLPFGEVGENHFTLFKSVAFAAWGGNSIYLFRFRGEYFPSGSETELRYTVSLPLLHYIVLGFICFFAIIVAIFFLINTGAPYFSAIALLPTIPVVVSISQGITCIKIFEKSLTHDMT